MAAPMVLDNGSFTIKAGRGGNMQAYRGWRRILTDRFYSIRARIYAQSLQIDHKIDFFASTCGLSPQTRSNTLISGEKKPSFSLRTVIAEHPQQANGDQKSRSGRKKKSKR
eukprot:1340164-Amorphochlora_amoeboformis.AAC.2